MHSKRLPVFALVLLLIASVAARADKVDDYIKAEMQKQHIPGLSLAVIKDGKIIKAQGYGMANVELNVPATAETVYKIGSVSKQFLAAGIMLLIQENKISLDDKISKFLEGTPDTWKDITVRHLLTHTSGIVREAPGFDALKIQNDADVIKTAYNLPLRFTPGEKYEYCNVGYFTLAEIIRKVSGKPWGDYLNERLFTPLEMNSTRTTTMTEIVPNRANGYVWRSGKLDNAGILFAVRPSGAFLSSVLDLAKWDAALYTDRILKQSTLSQMWAPVKLNSGATHPYGFGWELNTFGGHKAVHHGGSLPGFRAQFARFVDDKLTIVVLTNGDGANSRALALGVAGLYIPGLTPERTATSALSTGFLQSQTAIGHWSVEVQ
ncbi:MAG TPA: serine hydrolase domain-containing protein [Blastocatellia bacterium]|nr:serine hydrolase domain-containing protein [Blastocatellia bacterium]